MEKQELCTEVTKKAPSFLESGKGADCKFVVGAEPHQVVVEGYKVVMAIASPVFEAMFYGGLAETKDHIPIVDVETDIFKAMLRYIHTGYLKLNSCDEAIKLYYTANKYMLDNLKNECSNYLQNNVNQDNVCKLYEITLLYDDEALKRSCFNVMKALIKTQNSTDGPEEAKPGSSHINDGVICSKMSKEQKKIPNTPASPVDASASTPPPYSSCEPIAQDPIPMTSSWITEVSLVVKIPVGLPFLIYLTSIVDFYEGPYEMKPIVLGVYAMAMSKLTRTTDADKEFHYNFQTYRLVQFHHYDPSLKDMPVDMNWRKSFDTIMKMQVHIDFKLKMTPSKRTGAAFHQVYYSRPPLIIGNYLIDTLPAFEKIKKAFVLTDVKVSEKSIIF